MQALEQSPQVSALEELGESLTDTQSSPTSNGAGPFSPDKDVAGISGAELNERAAETLGCVPEPALIRPSNLLVACGRCLLVWHHLGVHVPALVRSSNLLVTCGRRLLVSHQRSRAERARCIDPGVRACACTDHVIHPACCAWRAHLCLALAGQPCTSVLQTPWGACACLHQSRHTSCL